MRSIDRSKVPEPESLRRYNHPEHCWDDFGGEDKKVVREALERLQNGCCAYCESATYEAGHIEHFRRKRHFPGLTFTWKNLFLSCSERDHCGHYKDRKGSPYNPQDVLKPDEDSPSKYLYFYRTGEVRLRPKLGPEEEWRARETLRVFHLACGPLEAARRRAVEQFLRKSPGILELLEDIMRNEGEDCAAEYIEAELESVAGQPHYTVILHLFETV